MRYLKILVLTIKVASHTIGEYTNRLGGMVSIYSCVAS